MTKNSTSGVKTNIAPYGGIVSTLAAKLTVYQMDLESKVVKPISALTMSANSNAEVNN
jgi:hypothetical protein